jgi:sugar diacid utilization regulator
LSSEHRTRASRETKQEASAAPKDEWLASVATAAAEDADAPSELLGEYLPLLADAAIDGRRPGRDELDRIAELGARAAQLGIRPGTAVNLYLSAAWRLWGELPVVVRSQDSEIVRGAAQAVLQVVGDAVAVLVEGHQAERRKSIRREESLRREFIDDLLRGDADVAGIVERAEPFGLDLTRSHQVSLASTSAKHADLEMLSPGLENAIVEHFGDRDVLVATKESLLVVLVPGSGGAGSTDRPDVGQVIHRTLSRGPSRSQWLVAVGRAYAGAYGIARSYEEAREALDLGGRLRLEQRVVHARDLLIYRVLGRDQAAMIDLVHAVLVPLKEARGGAVPLLTTVQTYLDAGGVATEAARRLHLSVRAVTYRLERVRELTGLDATHPDDAFTLQAAVLGARLLDWPAQPLPPAPSVVR